MGDGWNDICWRKELEPVTLPIPQPSDDSDDNDTTCSSNIDNEDSAECEKKKIEVEDKTESEKKVEESDKKIEEKIETEEVKRKEETVAEPEESKEEQEEKAKSTNCVAELLPSDAYSKLVSRVYIFPGAQVFLMNDEGDDDDNSNDDDSSDSSSNDSENFSKAYEIFEEASSKKDTSDLNDSNGKIVPDNLTSAVDADPHPVQYQYHNHPHLCYSNYHFHSYNSVEETQGDEISFKATSFDSQLNEFQAQIQMLQEENSQSPESLKQKFIDNSNEQPISKRRKTDEAE